MLGPIITTKAKFLSVTFAQRSLETIWIWSNIFGGSITKQQHLRTMSHATSVESSFQRNIAWSLTARQCMSLTQQIVRYAVETTRTTTAFPSTWKMPMMVIPPVQKLERVATECQTHQLQTHSRLSPWHFFCKMGFAKPVIISIVNTSQSPIFFVLFSVTRRSRSDVRQWVSGH